MVETGSSVILRCNRTAAERAGTYRAIHNRRYDMEDLIEAVSADCVRRCTGVRHVLCIQDTTEYDYDFLVCPHYDRTTDGGVRLSALISSVPPCLTFELEIPASHGRKRRAARMKLRFSKVRLLPPRKARKEEGDDIPLDACCVQAADPPGSAPPDCPPVEWRLLTSHDISTAEQALVCIGWYKARWLIEELFRVTKTKGFNVEEAALLHVLAACRTIAR